METNHPKNVVSFERSADYWRGAASRSRRAARYLDAAALYRKACAHDAEDAELGLELAATYADMQSYSASDRVLLSLLAHNPTMCPAYLSLALNSLHKGCPSLCASALDMCMRFCAGTGSYATQAWDIHDALYFPYRDDKRGARAASYARSAAHRYTAGDKGEALRLAKRACERSPGTTELWLYATLLFEQQHPQDALDVALRARSKAPESFPVCLLICDIYSALGKNELAKNTLVRAERLCRTPSELTGFCISAENAGALPAARALVESRLAAAPHSTDLLYLLAAVCAKQNDGLHAAALLDRLLAVDPADDIARYYANGRACMLPFARALPASEVRKRALSALASVSAPDFEAKYAHDDTLKADVLSLFSLGVNMQKYAVRLLYLCKDTCALREALLLSLDKDARKAIYECLLALGEHPPFLYREGDAIDAWPPEANGAEGADDGLRAMTHFLGLWLYGTVRYPAVCRLTRQAWEKLPLPCRAHCRAQQDDVWPLAFSLHILSCTGQTHKTQEIVNASPNKKRILRALTLIRSGTNEVHRL